MLFYNITNIIYEDVALMPFFKLCEEPEMNRTFLKNTFNHNLLSKSKRSLIVFPPKQLQVTRQPVLAHSVQLFTRVEP